MDAYEKVEKILELYNHSKIESKLNELQDNEEIKDWLWYKCNSWFIKSREYVVTHNTGQKISRFVYERVKEY